MGLYWAFLTFGLSNYDDDFIAEEFEIRFVEREIVGLEAVDDANPLVRFWADQGDRETDYDQLEELLSDHEESERVNQLRAYLAESEASEEMYSEREQDSQLWRVMVAQAVWFFALPGALVAMWMVRRNWRKRGKIWRVLGVWEPSVIWALFFLISILCDYFIFNNLGGILYQFFGDHWGGLLSDFFWRGGAALLASFVMVGSWGGIWRVYRLGQAVRWRAVFGTFSVLALLGSLQAWLGGVSEILDPYAFYFVVDPTGWDLLFDFMNGVVYAPIFEEMMFRGVLFLGLLKKWGPVPAALVSSIFFASIHTQYDLWEIFSVGVFGLGCCWLTWRTGSLKSSIVLHMIYNGLATSWVYLVYQMPL